MVGRFCSTLLEKLSLADVALKAARQNAPLVGQWTPEALVNANPHGLQAARCLSLLQDLISQCQVGSHAAAASTISDASLPVQSVDVWRAADVQPGLTQPVPF